MCVKRGQKGAIASDFRNISEITVVAALAENSLSGCIIELVIVNKSWHKENSPFFGPCSACTDTLGKNTEVHVGR